MTTSVLRILVTAFMFVFLAAPTHAQVINRVFDAVQDLEPSADGRHAHENLRPSIPGAESLDVSNAHETLSF